MLSNTDCERPSYSFVVATSQGYMNSYSQIESSSSGDNEMDSEETLNFGDTSHFHAKRFQVDRRKLEQMMKTETSVEGVNTAEEYFQKIMETTDTSITWPCKLKFGARSRKDPHVRVVGRPDDVNWAKGLILSNLATKGPMLRMKMVISNSDHAHIIGRGGTNINYIREETETHIHFPDTNRLNMIEKRNQVSLYGTLESLEKARVALRLSMPLLFSFEVPLGAKHDKQYAKQLETDYNVKIIFYSTSNQVSFRVLIKGYEYEANKVREATRVLLNSLCGFMAAHTPVIIQMEDCKQFHEIAHNTILSNIMERTGGKISFPDSFDASKNSQITIYGPIDGVHEAKKELIGHLPIELTYDIPDNQGVFAEKLRLNSKYGVSISKQYKQRDKSISVTVSAPEMNIQRIYDALQEILDMQLKLTNEVNVPKAYLLADPSYRRSMESEINSDSISMDIWAPTEPNSEWNYLNLSSTTKQFEITPRNNDSMLDYVIPSLYEYRATISPDSMDSSDWTLMKDRSSEDEDKIMMTHIEGDYDLQLLEAAFLLMR